MKKWILILLLLSGVAAANVFSAEKATVDVDVSSSVDIVGRVDSLKADVLFVPQQSKYMDIVSMDTSGSELSDRVRFFWSSPQNSVDFGYSAVVDVKNDFPKVKSKILYPFNFKGLEEYLEPSPNVDSDNPSVNAKAKEIAAGEDDLFILVSKVAVWAKENIKYNLSTLTADVSRPASWVLQNRVGVCDEITALFIAMLRSLDVPARFVSGVAFTNSPNFPAGWGAHGWAEVYFPGVGWVPYDPTFGQLGWVDPGHVKMKESIDPADSTVQVEWRGSADVEVNDLDVDASLASTSGNVKTPVKWSVAPLHGNVGFGSYNVVMADVESMVDYYVGGELSLSKVGELAPYDPPRLFILKPGEHKRLFWKVKVKESLDPEFQYEIPLVVYDIANFSQSSGFAVTNWDVKYSESDANSFIARESAVAPPDVELACVVQNDMLLPGESTSVDCRVSSHLNSPVDVDVCYDTCDTLRVPADGFADTAFVVSPENEGANDVVITAKTPSGELSSVLTVILLDKPKIGIDKVSVPSVVSMGESFDMTFTVRKKSYAVPRNATVRVTGAGAEVELPLGDLAFDQDVVISVSSDQLYSKNPVFDIGVLYKDEAGRSYSAESSAQTTVQGVSWYRSVIGWFMGLFGR